MKILLGYLFHQGQKDHVIDIALIGNTCNLGVARLSVSRMTFGHHQKLLPNYKSVIPNKPAILTILESLLHGAE